MTGIHVMDCLRITRITDVCDLNVTKIVQYFCGCFQKDTVAL